MLKHSSSLSTLDQELFPGVREEKDTRLWLLRKWAFAVILSVGLVYWRGSLWQTGAQRVEAITGKTSLQNSTRHRSIAQSAHASMRPDKSKTSASDTASASVLIPKGTVIPVKVESTRPGDRGQTVILARARSFVLPDKTVLIPAGSQIEGMAHHRAGKWEIHWHSVSVVSAEGREADIQAMNEVPGKASLYGRSLLIKAK